MALGDTTATAKVSILYSQFTLKSLKMSRHIGVMVRALITVPKNKFEVVKYDASGYLEQSMTQEIASLEPPVESFIAGIERLSLVTHLLFIDTS